MIFGAHVIMYSKDADADRGFFADILGLPSVDAGHGWLIFALPPAELAVHPAHDPAHELYLMCDDLGAEMQTLEAKGVPCSEVEEARWGSATKVPLPGGGEVGLYQPRHPSPLSPRPDPATIPTRTTGLKPTVAVSARSTTPSSRRGPCGAND